MGKSYPIYKEEYNVYLIELDDKVYRVQIYFQVQKIEVPSETPRKRLPTTREVTKVREIYVEEIFKFGGGKNG